MKKLAVALALVVGLVATPALACHGKWRNQGYQGPAYEQTYYGHRHAVAYGATRYGRAWHGGWHRGWTVHRGWGWHGRWHRPWVGHRHVGSRTHHRWGY